MYHGVAIDQSFKDPNFVKTFKEFNHKMDEGWGIYGIEIEDDNLDSILSLIQQNLKEDQPWYAHFYNEAELIVIFRDKLFRVKPDKSTWDEIIKYGKSLKIPEEQLDFWPNRFQDEVHYFN